MIEDRIGERHNLTVLMPSTSVSPGKRTVGKHTELGCDLWLSDEVFIQKISHILMRSYSLDLELY